MPRQMLPEREKEYAELHAFVDYYATKVEGIDPKDPVHPTNVGVEILRKYSKSQALAGLRQAAHDIVEDCADLTGKELAQLDDLFTAAGRITISEVRRRHASAYKRLIKRGVIRSETEYYLANGILADVESFASQEERETLERMVAEFGRRQEGAVTRTNLG